MKTNSDLVSPLLSALRDIVRRCDGREGVQPDGSNMDTSAAHVAIRDAEKALQEIAHEAGEPCDEECQECCGEFVGHEYDPDEGGYCLNCNHHPND
jgi:hypothetical protein